MATGEEGDPFPGYVDEDVDPALVYPALPPKRVPGLGSLRVNPAFVLHASDGPFTGERGWDAVERVITTGVPASAVVTVSNKENGPFGSAVLDGVVVVDHGPFWEMVSRGFSEVNALKESAVAGRNGYGFELVLRLKKSDGPDGTPPLPLWVPTLFAALLQHHADTGAIEAGTTLEVTPDQVGGDSELCVLTVSADHKWGAPIHTAFGSLALLQVVPVTKAEADVCVDALGVDTFLEALYDGETPVADMRRPDTSTADAWKAVLDST